MTTIENSKRDIQGFVTSGYGHTYHAAYLFVKFGVVEQAKSWLSNIIPQVISAQSWRQYNTNPCHPEEERPPKIKPKTLLNIAFTIEGLGALGLSYNALRTLPVEMQQGMTDPVRQKLLGDTEESAPEHWEIGGTKNPEFHAVLILHAGASPEDEATLTTFVEVQKVALEAAGIDVIHDERGNRRDDDKEMFGFKDGIAQPKIRGINQFDSRGLPIKNLINPGEFILGHQSAYGLYPVAPAVPRQEDPHDILPTLLNPQPVYPLYHPGSLKDFGNNGTYLAYRKLHQHVSKFWHYIVDEIKRMDGDVTAERAVWLASKFVGRHPNGDPLVPDLSKLADQDDFRYHDHDPDGKHCPFGSHLRRSNPRDVFIPTDKETSLDTVDKHRIIRRGRNFGAALFDLALLDNPTDEMLQTLLALEDDDEPRGLHFFSVQANLQRQFEFIQESWSNNPDFNGMFENKDPIVGDNMRANQKPSRMYIPADPVRIRTSDLPRFVTVRGGVYLFMPGITALRFLAA